MTTSSSSRWQRRDLPPAGGPAMAGAAKTQAYARFIPREELAGFAVWSPAALEGSAAAAPADGPRSPATPRRAEAAAAASAAAAPAATAAAIAAAAAAAEAQAHAARQSGYQDGYRDGLAGLDAFKQSFASQTSTQIGRLTEAFDGQLDALQVQLADTLTRTALLLAQQVVRSELALRPELVAMVAGDAVDALLAGARQVTVRVHPDDQRLVADGAGEALGARGARLIGDTAVQRGGCRVESDLGGVDATIAARWARAAASLGSNAGWDDLTSGGDAGPTR